MEKYLSSKVGGQIKVDRGGPESKQGILLDVNQDYFTLLTEDDGVIYFNSQHVKSITSDPKKENEKKVELPQDFTYFKGESFTNILSQMSTGYMWITINRGGPEKLEGVLVDVDESGISLVVKDSVVKVANFHIRSVSYGNNPSDNSEEKKENQKEQ